MSETEDKKTEKTEDVIDGKQYQSHELSIDQKLDILNGALMAIVKNQGTLLKNQQILDRKIDSIFSRISQKKHKILLPSGG